MTCPLSTAKVRLGSFAASLRWTAGVSAAKPGEIIAWIALPMRPRPAILLTRCSLSFFPMPPLLSFLPRLRASSSITSLHSPALSPAIHLSKRFFAREYACAGRTPRFSALSTDLANIVNSIHATLDRFISTVSATPRPSGSAK